MALFWEFFTFEIKFRFKSLSTYVYFLVWLTFSFLCVASESFGPIGNSNGKVLLNSAYSNAYNNIGAALFGIIIIAAIFGTSVLRDFQRDTYQILFTQPISKFAYLGGRWAGSFVTTVFAFSGMMFGTYFGTFAPWADHTRIGPNHLLAYLQPFFSILVVQIFFIGSIFFAVSALSRKIFIVYLQGVALFMLYVIGLTVFSATRSLERFWSGILDPIGPILFDDVTRYWTVVEKNSLFVTWSPALSSGVFLYNRLLWMAVGFLALGAVWALFPMSVEALTARSQGRRAAKAREQEITEALPVRRLVGGLPLVHRAFGPATTFTQYVSLSRLRLRNILRDIPFWAIVVLLLAFGVNNGYFAGRVAERNVWPVTYLMVQAVEGSALLFLFIVAALYSAELLWRERDTHFDGIHDALPIRESTDWLSRLTAVVVVGNHSARRRDGGRHSDADHRRLLPLRTPAVLQGTVRGDFPADSRLCASRTLCPDRCLQQVFGPRHRDWPFCPDPDPLQLRLGEYSLSRRPDPAYIYSDMNGYGHFVPALFWSITYWLAIMAVLGVASIALARRGAEDSLRARFRSARARAPRLAPVALLFALIAAGAGSWYFYNTHVLNEYLDSKARRGIQADYERQFKQYENLPQPKITAVDATINIYPIRRSFDGNVRLTLENKTSQPIAQIHVTDKRQSVTNLQFDRSFRLVSSAARNMYSIYSLDQPLAPGETLILTCNVGHQTRGFRDGNEPPSLPTMAPSSTPTTFPTSVTTPAWSLTIRAGGAKNIFPLLEEMAHRGDPAHSLNNIFLLGESDWITYHSVVSTSPDQIAVAPGYLQREWQANGRRYFEYSMGTTHVLDFFAFISGRYQVRKETYHGPNGDVALEVYYDPAHNYDVDDMLASSRAGLDYYQRVYSPYQFSQYRIFEFPRYRTFAQSFPNTVPYSEGIGFIGRVIKPTDIDFSYFVTAHELGHQWWAHQLVGADVEGSNMMSESLAEYSALQVMAHKYGRDLMHRYLRHELDSYLRGRSGEVRHEPPLGLVQREPYVWYQKGGQILYTIADYIGEDNLNLALRNFLMQYRYANANNQVDAQQKPGVSDTRDKSYPDTRQMVEAIIAQTPPELKYLVDDGFNRIVLYDNKTISATSQKTADGKYKVTMEVQARKVQADGNGAENPMPLADYIEIGVFSGKKDEEKPLYLKKEKFTEEHKTFVITVDQTPTLAGIDPYNKLIDRNADDNMIDVTKQ